MSGGQAPQMPVQDVMAHLRRHPGRLQEGVHAQSVQRRQQPLCLDRQLLLPVAVVRYQSSYHLPDDGSHLPVAPIGNGCEEGTDPGCILEGHPHAGVHGTFVVKRQKFTQQG